MYQASLPLAATAMLAFVMSRWASDELAREGRLSQAAAAGATALVVLHGLIVVICTAGAVAVVGIPEALALGIGIPLAVAGGLLTAGGLTEAGGWRRIFKVEPGPAPEGPVHSRIAHPLHLGWAALLVGVALAGRSGLAIGLAVIAAIWLWRIARNERVRAAEVEGRLAG